VNDGLVVLADELLSRHTALRTGGPCGAWVVVHRQDALARVISDCREAGWKWTLLGAGTRTIVRDGAVRGAVLRLGTAFGELRRTDSGFEVGAAVPVPALVAAARDAGWSGVSSFAGIPGSFGASLALDAGWEPWVTSVRFLYRGKVREAQLADIQGRQRVLLGATLHLGEGNSERLRKATRKALAAAHPGSWYAAPKRGTIRHILASAQLPMVRLRRVAIPDAAPETLVNLGGGTAADLALLHKSASERVKKTRGLDLTSRMRWMGPR
jgi:UDP-N-acetylmuramate dehydrogenase